MGKKEKSAKDAKADTPKKESKAAKPAKSTPKADDGPAPEPAPLALPGGQMDPKLAALFASAKPSEAPPKPVIKPAAPKPVTPKVEPAAEAPANEKKRKRDEQKTAPPAEPPVDAKQKQKEKGKQGPAQEPVAEPAPKKKKDRKGPAAKTENATEPAKEPVKEQKAVKDDSKDVVPASEPSDDELETDEKGTRVKPEDDPRLPRTIFLGNVPTTAMKNPVLKRLKKLLSTHGKLESLRFRSVAPAKAGIPKRAAVLGNQMHPDRDTVHAYAVFAEEAMAEQAAKELNGTVFEEKHLRADMAGKSSEKDHRRTVFVGNLPFDISDEALWSHFADAGDIVSVRVVRDPATQVGKGFAYVRFVEKSAMQLALDLEGSELAGRKIRVTRSAEKKKRPAAREKPKPMGAERRLATKTGKPGKKPTSFEGARAKPGDTVKLRKPKGAAGKNKPGKKKVHRGRKPGDKKGK